MKHYLEGLLLASIAVFAPIKAVLITTFVLVAIDLVTGILAARKRGEPITSRGFKRTVGKFFMYETAVCVAFLVEQYLTGDLLPINKLVAAMIGLTELKSILENMDVIQGSSMFDSILRRVTQTQEQQNKVESKEDDGKKDQ